MLSDKRKSGIATLGELQWGIHFCQLYQTTEELLEILLPYFEAGVENNELCVWITSDAMPPGEEDAKKLLEINAPRLWASAANGQVRIMSYSRWRGGQGVGGSVIASIHENAVAGGFDGLRIAFSAASETSGSKAVAREIAEISNDNALALFAYPRNDFDTVGIMEVIKNHRFALVRNADRWEVIESSEARILKEELRRSDALYRSLFNNMMNGFAYCRMLFNGDRPDDFIYLAVNDAFEKLTGLKDVVGKRVTEVIPGIRESDPALFDIYGRVAMSGVPEQFETYLKTLDMWFSISVYSPAKGHFVAVFDVITERKKTEEEIIKLNEAQKRAVEELQAANTLLIDSRRAALNMMEDAITTRRQAEETNRKLQSEIAERKRAEQEISRRNAVLAGINAILTEALSSETDEQLARACLRIAEELTGSKFGFIGEIGPDGLLHDIAISDPGWELCAMHDKMGHRRPPGDFQLRGIYGRVLLDGRAFFTNDPSGHPDSIGTPAGHPPLKAFLGVPFVQDGRTVGMIAVGNRDGGYRAAEQDSLESLAPAVIEALQRTRSERSLRQSLRRFEILAVTASDLLQSLEPKKAAESICKRVMEHLDCHAFFNFLVDEQAGRLRLNACAGIPEDEVKRIEWVDFGVAVCGCVARDGKRIVAEHIPATADPRTDLVKSYGIKAYCCNPLLGPGGKVIGTLSFGTRGRETFSEDDISLMKAVTDQVAVAMTRRKSEQEVLKLSEDMAARNLDLESANKEMESFIYSISHDLRAPIRTMSGFAKIIVEDYIDKLDEQGKDYLSRIQNGAERATQLIDDLLRLARISRQDMEFVNVDLSRRAEAVAAGLRESSPERNVEFDIAADLTALADPVLVEIVLSNLLGNAWKFTSKTENARIEFGADQTGGKTVFFVQDNGAGFDPAYTEKMFWPFQRFHSEKEFEGTGIGLTIVERVIRRHGGKIWADGEVGKGATFYFTLG